MKNVKDKSKDHEQMNFSHFLIINGRFWIRKKFATHILCQRWSDESFMKIGLLEVSIVSCSTRLSSSWWWWPRIQGADCFGQVLKLQFWTITFFSGKSIYIKDKFCQKKSRENVKPGRSNGRCNLPPHIKGHHLRRAERWADGDKQIRLQKRQCTR